MDTRLGRELDRVLTQNSILLAPSHGDFDNCHGRSDGQPEIQRDTMVTRFVHQAQGKLTGDFDSKTSPAKHIHDAIRKADPGDTVEILDAATYVEPELIIDQPLTVIGTNPAGFNDDPRMTPGFGLVKSFPTIKPQGKHRVLTIRGTPKTRTTAGRVFLNGVNITGGRAQVTAKDPAHGAGGGIAVIDLDNVTIERCAIINNSTFLGVRKGWPRSDRLAFRTATLDLAGHLLSSEFEAGVNLLIVGANKVLKTLRRGSLASFSRATALSKLALAFDRKFPPKLENFPIGGQGFGGGVATVWASPTVRNCLIAHNHSQGRGGGIGVVGYSWPTIDSCSIFRNSTGSRGRRDGGGMGCEVALPGKLTRDLGSIDLIRFLTPRIVKVKATITNPLSHISSSDITALFTSASPGTVATGIKAILLAVIGGNWLQAIDHLFYFTLRMALSISRFDAWNRLELIQARENRIKLIESTVFENNSHDDGGGFYATVMARSEISDTTFSGNVAGGLGGGVRLSMGSSAHLKNCQLIGNFADPTEKSKSIPGGGAIAARNADLELTKVQIGKGSSIGVHSNLCSNHPGGGIAFQADTEGSLFGIRDGWTAILAEVFEVRSVEFKIVGGIITNNGAGFSDSRKAIPGVKRAKGGGIWLLQGSHPDAPRLELRIEEFKRVVINNLAMTKSYRSTITGAIIPSAHELLIQDLINSREISGKQLNRLIKSRTLKYSP